MTDDLAPDEVTALPASMRDATPTPAEELRNIRMAVITFGIIVSVILLVLVFLLIPIMDHVTGAFDERNGIASAITAVLPAV